MDKKGLTQIQKAGFGAIVGITGFIIGGLGIGLNNNFLTKIGLGLIALGGIIWS